MLSLWRSKTIEPLASQTHLHNPAKGGFSHYMPDNDGARWADEMNYRMSEGMAQQGGSSASMYGLEDGTEIIEFTLGRVDSDPVGFQGGLLNCVQSIQCRALPDHTTIRRHG